VDAELRTVSQNLAQLTAQYESLNSIIAEQSGIKSKASVLAYNIKKTAERICPTCTQDWPDSQSALERMKSELELLLNTYKNNIAKLAALPQVKSDIDAMQSKYRELYAKKSELSSASASRATLLRSLNAQMAAINQAKINRQRALEQLSLAKKQASALEKDIEVDRLAAQAIGRSGFLGVFFAEVLSEIASEANSLMAKIPNVQDLTVSFSTETITKSGATKNQISTNLYKAGVPVVYKNLSGGQQSSLELCVDLALRSVVLRRNGIQLNFAAMDEALDGLDTENKYAALEVIKTNIAGTVLVIDHATEIKELFSQIVNVYYDGASSRTMYEKAQASA
jgi:DNA repair exonuclease SbcCD ATPase subunit